MAEIRKTGLSRVFEVIPQRFGDDRGFFCETYNAKNFADLGIGETFVQDNHSLSANKGTLRGLHFQVAPTAQAKLIRVVKGSIFDVAVDIDRSSESFGNWISCELKADTGNQLFVPAGYAHGFLTLENDTEVVYKVDQYYSKDHDRSIRFDDPEFAIEWPDLGIDFELSHKDRSAPYLKDL